MFVRELYVFYASFFFFFNFLEAYCILNVTYRDFLWWK